MSILDVYELGDDLRVQLDRDKVMPGDDWMEGIAGIEEQLWMAGAAEGAQQAHAYVEYLRAASMCLKRAYRLCDARQVPGKGDAPE